MRAKRVIIWFRQDLRLHDNEALLDAMAAGEELLPVYVFDPRVFQGTTMFGFPKTGRVRYNFIRESVIALRDKLRAIGSDLVVRTGRPEDEIFRIANAIKSGWVFCNRERTDDEIKVQDALERNLWSIGQEVRFSRGKMLYYTTDLPFPVTHTPDHFTTFRKETERFVPVRDPLPEPEELPPLPRDVDPGDIPGPGFVDDPLAADTVDLMFPGGEKEGLNQLDALCRKMYEVDDDAQNAEQFAEPRLSPWLAQGCISPKAVLHTVQSYAPGEGAVVEQIRQNLFYRDFLRLMAKKYGNRIFQRGGIARQPPEVSEKDRDLFHIWARAHTGLPIIDAAMHQLNQTGFMPHKLRVLCAHFLIRELGMAWRLGASYFESRLVDYDPCSNWVSWNFAAGLGPEQKEERRHNYVLQARRLDPEGAYVKRWIPALKNAHHQWVHQPDQAPGEDLKNSHIVLGKDYPKPVLSSDRWNVI